MPPPLRSANWGYDFSTNMLPTLEYSFESWDHGCMTALTEILARLGDLSVAPPEIATAGMGDRELLDGQRAVAELARRVDAVAAALAGEIAYRSRPELGHSGLAQSNGQRTAEGLISHLTGSTSRDARTLVKTAELLPVAATRPEAKPLPAWKATIGGAVRRGGLSAEAAELLISRLGQALRPDAASDEQQRVESALASAAERLVAEAAVLPLEQLATRASRLRDEIDLAGVAAREEQLREKRFLRLTPQLDGSTRISGLLDPESAAIVVPVLHAATSPRRGPRFVEPDATPTPADQVRDERTPEQLALDTFVELLRAGARVDDGTLLGDRSPAVRVLVSHRELQVTPDADGHRPGTAYFEGQQTAVSIATAERFICAGGAIPIAFDDDGRALNLGRTQRLFSEKQRIALAARDGGCLMCDRPPSWCEAHHIDHWHEHHGETNIDDGVLLCRFCHLLVHNRGWRITRTGADYHLEKPDDDGILRRTPLPRRSPALDRMLATA